MKVEGTQDINDWHLILFHEEDFMMEFSEGGDTFVDIGAHVGAWSLKLAKFYQRVVAFEPHPEAFAALEKNIELNNLRSKIIPMNRAIGSENGKLKLTLYEHPSHSTLHEHHPMESHCGAKKGEVEVEVIKLDSFDADVKIDLIKIDVEGFEVEVVKGALETIKKHKPKLIIEIHSPENEQKVKDLLPEITFRTKSNGTQPYLISE